MLKIRLNKIEQFEGKYHVFLDSENKYAFVNKRQASDFLTLISKRLTDTLIYINEEYTVVEGIYRQYFFLIENFQISIQIENSLEFIRTKISLLLFRTAGENRNTLVISGIENMLFELKTVYSQIDKLAISRSDAGIRHKIATKTRIPDLFLMDFKHFEDEITVSRSEISVKHEVKLRKVI